MVVQFNLYSSSVSREVFEPFA